MGVKRRGVTASVAPFVQTPLNPLLWHTGTQTQDRGLPSQQPSGWVQTRRWETGLQAVQWGRVDGPYQKIGAGF